MTIMNTSQKVIKTLGAATSIFVLANLWGYFDANWWAIMAILLMCIFALEYLPIILNVNGEASKAQRLWCAAWLLASLAPQFYLLFEIPRLEFFYGSDWTSGDIVFGTLAIITILYLNQRKFGLSMTVISVFFIAYALWGDLLPLDYMGHEGFSFERLVSFTFGPGAIYGTVYSTFARIIFLYMLFGAFLTASGVGEYIINGAFAVAGRFRGGPAKVAVVASGLMGMINGNSVANVCTVGQITIPMMKRVGYRPQFAGAVEAVASTGGQIMPPVMGAGAFIMAEFLQISYSAVAIAAAIPAVLYYLAVFLMVDLEAVKTGLRGMAKEDIKTEGTLKKSILMLPAIVLVYELIVNNASVSVAGIEAIVCSLLCSWCFKEYRMGPTKIFNALYEGAKESVGIAAICAASGIIIGAVAMTGLGTKFSSMVLMLAQGNMVILGILTGAICLVLGLGLPTVASYIITVAVAAPALLKAGVTPLAAHMFVFYFAILSSITPPVAGAAFAGATIAGSGMQKTGFEAMRLAMVAYFMPFFFLNNQALLAQGPMLDIVEACVTGIIGTVILAIVVQNVTYHRYKIGLVERVIYAAASVFLLDPGKTSDIIGVVLIAVAFGIGVIRRKNAKAKGEDLLYEIKAPVIGPIVAEKIDQKVIDELLKNEEI